MKRRGGVHKFRRRDMFQSGVVLAGASALSQIEPAGAAVPSAGAVRDRFWLWGHPAGSHNKNWNLPAPSRITPVEAAFYMSLPNMIHVRYYGDPEPPFQQFAIPFRALREVVWSLVGASGATDSREREAVLELAAENPNFSGVMMDDFFTGNKEGKLAALTVSELQRLQKRLKGGGKSLDLWVVLYDHQLEDPVRGHLKQCDVVTFWTWKAADLRDLKPNFEKVEKLAPTTRKALGCYMWDYGEKKPLPVATMEKQCELGLEWLKQGRIDGMIFLASCICDLGLETVEWTREWIQKVGGEKLTRS